MRATSVVLPTWFLALATAALPTLWIVRRVRTRRQRRPGHCRRCGYDLRESPDRCPECGADVASRPALHDEPEA